MVWLMGIAAVKMGCYWFFSGFDMHAFLLLREPEKDSAISNLEFCSCVHWESDTPWSSTIYFYVRANYWEEH